MLQKLYPITGVSAHFGGISYRDLDLVGLLCTECSYRCSKKGYLTQTEDLGEDVGRLALLYDGFYYLQ
jgi:hypothetical protein